jgi:hypothetical protein
MKKVKKDRLQEQQKHKRALQSARRRKSFKKLKEQWKLGIGLYETYTQEERDKSDQL